MNLDQLLYVFIYQAVFNFCKYFGVDTSNTGDITQNVCIAILNILDNEEKAKKVKNWDAYIKGIIAKVILTEMRLEQRRHTLQEQAYYIFDKYDEADTDIIKGQAKHATQLIDDYIKKNPGALTDRSKQLWDLFKQGITEPEKVMEAMKITNVNTYYSIKRRLITQLITIYQSLGSAS